VEASCAYVEERRDLIMPSHLTLACISRAMMMQSQEEVHDQDHTEDDGSLIREKKPGSIQHPFEVPQ
jgi:hypothetical protein